jgi:precorrin-6B methylase 2
MMTNESSSKRKGDPVYALGHSEEERRRLTEQDVFVGHLTRRLFLEAGIGPGMRVLDVGCGVGDVSLLAASLVGPESSVYGFAAGVLRSLLPMAEQLGVTSAEEVGIETLHERMRDEVVALGGAVAIPTIASAFAQKPAEQVA